MSNHVKLESMQVQIRYANDFNLEFTCALCVREEIARKALIRMGLGEVKWAQIQCKTLQTFWYITQTRPYPLPESCRFLGLKVPAFNCYCIQSRFKVNMLSRFKNNMLISPFKPVNV